MTGLSDLAAWGLTALLLYAALLMLRRPLAWLIRFLGGNGVRLSDHLFFAGVHSVRPPRGR